ncbi:class I SAM-dependent methyltransferase [Niabella ginsengisoli]|uniref:Class I SAM-dependent methyltransferase n=1 Tax=Niabella ginsengisoli TaxID=522298 RepID=A0ABS9SGQ6_9BACT|nr:class I SAM-dependent methyltransferase [Niabella ginsengisoli]
MQEVSDAIGLKNITVQHTRVEEIKNRKFDYVISRAVAPLKDLWTWGRPLIQKNLTPAPLPRERGVTALLHQD